MMRSLFSGVSGLKNHQTRMDVIGNNISNVNTTGFKSSRVNFTDMLSQTLSGASTPQDNLGGTNPKQIGLGSAVGAVDLLFTNGSVQSTGVNTDLALSSTNALFILNTGSGTAYTRNGDFQFDADGNYFQAGNGYFVQGWMANNGTIDTGAAVTNITIPSGKTMAPRASLSGAYTNNLNAEVPTITKVTGGSTVLTLSDGEKVTVSDDKEYNVGDVYSTAIKTHTTSGDPVTVSSGNAPVKVFLADGRTLDGMSGTGSDSTTGWKVGYTITATGTPVTPSATTNVTLKSAGGKTATGAIGTPYSVGDTYMGSKVTTGTVTTTGSAAENCVKLYLSDGTEHDVSATSTTYNIGTDTYTYTDAGGVTHTATVTGYAQGFIINEMTVTSPLGNNASVDVGGIASRDGNSATASASNTVTLKLANGNEVAGTPGETYTVGSVYTTPITTSGTTGNVNASNPIRLYLADGTYVDDNSSGIDYTVGDPYTYTSAGGTPVNTTITGFSSISTILSIHEEVNIIRVEETEQITVAGVETIATSDNPATVTLSDASTVVQTSGKYSTGNSLPIVTTLSVYDTLGSAHDLPVYFTLTDASTDTWSVTLTTDGSTSTSWTEADGSTTTATMDPITLDFDENGAFASGTGTTTLTLTNGSQGIQNVQLDFTAMTQYSSGSTIAGKCDGNAAGTLSSVSIDKTGTITGTYTNGMKQVEAQVALQRFNNPGGLTKVGESLYEDSNNAGKSGEPNTASALGATITPSALEMSNVDIANEFTDMIVTQRGFQGNSKIITVSDEMLETLINMKR